MSQSWQLENINDITGGFTDAVGDGGPPGIDTGGDEAANPSLSNSSLSFYFVNPGTTETVTYTWTLSNQQSAQATADFNILGPTNVSVATSTNSVVIVSNGNSASLSFGANATTTPGITFMESSTPPISNGQQHPGTFLWVQLIKNDLSQLIDSTGAKVCRPIPLESDPLHPVLDAVYPYSTGTVTRDSPGNGLTNNLGEVSRETFTPTMYLMWDPATGPNGCQTASVTDNADGSSTPHTSTCTSTPIPLGSVSWSYSSCAVNTLQNQTSGTTWTQLCGSGKVTSAFQSSEYPHWTKTDPSGNSIMVSCERE